MSVSRLLSRLLPAVLAAGCARSAPPVPAAPVSSTGPRAIAVYRAIAESIYVRSTGRVVAVAAAFTARCG